MKRHLLLLFLFVSAATFAQQAEDVLRYSYLAPGGTARYLGAGGAFGALGAEFSTLSQNPAGLAMFRTDELMFTPAIKFTNTDATLTRAGNSTTNETKSNFHFDNLGIVFNTNPRNSRWKTFNVGLGFNQINNYNRGIYYTGDGNGTILNGWYAFADDHFRGGGSPEDLYPFAEGLAWETGAIYDPNPDDGILDWTYDFAGNEDAVIERSQIVTQSGSMNEMVMSFAGNFDEKLMVGATIGVPFVKYRLNSSYTESDPDQQVQYFDELTFNDYLQTDGLGINLKIGVIYRVNQVLRLGTSIHSPTWMRLTDKFDNAFNYQLTGDSGESFSYDATSPSGTFDYKLATPWRAAFSGAAVIGKRGFVSADVEFVDYSANRFNYTSDIANSENQAAERMVNDSIRIKFNSKVNFRLGGELALDQFRVRAGLNLLEKPFANESGYNMAYTTGVGVRAEAFYLDLGYRFSSGESSVSAYNDEKAKALTKNKAHDFILTIGFKF